MVARYGQKIGQVRKWLHFDALQRMAGDLMPLMAAFRCTAAYGWWFDAYEVL